MFSKIKNNSQYRFIASIVVIIVLSTIGTIYAVVHYHEDIFAKKVSNEIENHISMFSGQITKLDIYTRNEKFNQWMNGIEFYAGQSGLFHKAELYDRNQKQIFELNFEPLNEEIKAKLASINAFTEETSHKLIPISDEEGYFYYQTRITAEGLTFYLNTLTKLNASDIQMVEEEINTTLLIVFLTIAVIFLATFPIVRAQYRSLIEKQTELLVSNFNMLQSLGNAVAKRDSDTNEHNYRVTYYSLRIAEELGCSTNFIEGLIKGAFLHDVGKIAISDSILLKPGKLDTTEFEMMKSHVGHGVDIVENISWLDDAKDVILYHHEKVDGSGYPHGLKGREIPLSARIFAVADVFDALTSRRPYKEPFSVEKSIGILKEDTGSHFCPEVMGIFRKIYEESHSIIFEKDIHEMNAIFEKSMDPYFKN